MRSRSLYLLRAAIATAVLFVLTVPIGYYGIYNGVVTTGFYNRCYAARGHVMLDGGPGYVCLDSNYDKDLFRSPVLWPMHGYPEKKQ